MPVYDFHTHTFLSDGVLSPMELIRRAYFNGYQAIAITDHVGIADQERTIPILVEECGNAMAKWNIIAIPGVEITHVPHELIPQAAHKAKSLGARLVIVHGETIVEPVETGTNSAAVDSPDVNVLAHPGLITESDAGVAATKGVFLELSPRRGHSLTNGHVAKVALSKGALLLLNSDTHQPDDLLTDEFAKKTILGAGLTDEHLYQVTTANPQKLLAELGYSAPRP
ncbi:MAG: histidinol phosphate phosphatase domain-containing protein [Chloroflexota bacterium]|nr:histidinol phosphate phosphatase domain-containing protein [Chloroflexota bacterium]